MSLSFIRTDIINQDIVKENELAFRFKENDVLLEDVGNKKNVAEDTFKTSEINKHESQVNVTGEADENKIIPLELNLKEILNSTFDMSKFANFDIFQDEGTNAFKAITINMIQENVPKININLLAGIDAQRIFVSHLKINKIDPVKGTSEGFLMDIHVDDNGKLTIKTIKQVSHESSNKRKDNDDTENGKSSNLLEDFNNDVLIKSNEILLSNNLKKATGLEVNKGLTNDKAIQLSDRTDEINEIENILSFIELNLSKSETIKHSIKSTEIKNKTDNLKSNSKESLGKLINEQIPNKIVQQKSNTSVKEKLLQTSMKMKNDNEKDLKSNALKIDQDNSKAFEDGTIKPLSFPNEVDNFTQDKNIKEITTITSSQIINENITSREENNKECVIPQLVICNNKKESKIENQSTKLSNEIYIFLDPNNINDDQKCGDLNVSKISLIDSNAVNEKFMSTYSNEMKSSDLNNIELTTANETKELYLTNPPLNDKLHVESIQTQKYLTSDTFGLDFSYDNYDRSTENKLENVLQNKIKDNLSSKIQNSLGLEKPILQANSEEQLKTENLKESLPQNDLNSKTKIYDFNNTETNSLSKVNVNILPNPGSQIILGSNILSQENGLENRNSEEILMKVAVNENSKLSIESLKGKVSKEISIGNEMVKEDSIDDIYINSEIIPLKSIETANGNKYSQLQNDSEKVNSSLNENLQKNGLQNKIPAEVALQNPEVDFTNSLVIENEIKEVIITFDEKHISLKNDDIFKSEQLLQKNEKIENSPDLVELKLDKDSLKEAYPSLEIHKIISTRTSLVKGSPGITKGLSYDIEHIPVNISSNEGSSSNFIIPDVNRLSNIQENFENKTFSTSDKHVSINVNEKNQFDQLTKHKCTQPTFLSNHKSLTPFDDSTVEILPQWSDLTDLTNIQINKNKNIKNIPSEVNGEVRKDSLTEVNVDKEVIIRQSNAEIQGSGKNSLSKSVVMEINNQIISSESQNELRVNSWIKKIEKISKEELEENEIPVDSPINLTKTDSIPKDNLTVTVSEEKKLNGVDMFIEMNGELKIMTEEQLIQSTTNINPKDNPETLNSEETTKQTERKSNMNVVSLSLRLLEENPIENILANEKCIKISTDEKNKYFKAMTINIDQENIPLLNISLLSGVGTERILLSHIIENKLNVKDILKVDELLMNISVNEEGAVTIESMNNAGYQRNEKDNNLIGEKCVENIESVCEKTSLKSFDKVDSRNLSDLKNISIVILKEENNILVVTDVGKDNSVNQTNIQEESLQLKSMNPNSMILNEETTDYKTCHSITISEPLFINKMSGERDELKKENEIILKSQSKKEIILDEILLQKLSVKLSNEGLETEIQSIEEAFSTKNEVTSMKTFELNSERLESKIRLSNKKNVSLNDKSIKTDFSDYFIEENLERIEKYQPIWKESELSNNSPIKSDCENFIMKKDEVLLTAEKLKSETLMKSLLNENKKTRSSFEILKLISSQQDLEKESPFSKLSSKKCNQVNQENLVLEVTENDFTESDQMKKNNENDLKTFPLQPEIEKDESATKEFAKNEDLYLSKDNLNKEKKSNFQEENKLLLKENETNVKESCSEHNTLNEIKDIIKETVSFIEWPNTKEFNFVKKMSVLHEGIEDSKQSFKISFPTNISLTKDNESSIKEQFPAESKLQLISKKPQYLHMLNDEDIRSFRAFPINIDIDHSKIINIQIIPSMTSVNVIKPFISTGNEESTYKPSELLSINDDENKEQREITMINNEYNLKGTSKASNEKHVDEVIIVLGNVIPEIYVSIGISRTLMMKNGTKEDNLAINEN